MPITLGPQASCSTRYPRYGKNIDPTISPITTNTYSAARSQGRAEAAQGRRPPRSASASSAGSTLFYDLEAFNIRASTTCTNSALWFLHRLDPASCTTYGYASGYYSSAASGIRMIDDHRVRPDNPLDHARPGLDRRLERQGQHQLVVHPQRRVAALRPDASSTRAGTTRPGAA